MKTPTPRRLALLLALLPLSLPAQTTGWLQTLYGPWDYNTAANWVGANINGRWDESLTLGAHQVATFAADTVLTYPLHFGYVGGVDLRLQGSGGDRILTLGGDITHATASGRAVNFGNTGTGSGLSLNLGGVPRTFTVLTGRTLKPYSALSNGSITLTGSGLMSMTADAATGVGVDLLVDQVTTLEFASAGSGATRAANVALRSGILKVTGNATASSIDTVASALSAVAANPAGSYSCSIVTVAPNAARNARLVADSFNQSSTGVVLFRGTNLGTNTIASQTANNANIQFGTAPTLIGGNGPAGSTTVSILPGAIGGTTTSDGGTTFVTYDAANGIRPLSTSTEFATNILDGAVTADNVRLRGTGVVATVTSPTTINSLIVVPSSTVNTSIAGSGTLKVTSGQVLLNPGNVAMTTTILAPLDFGAVRGVIGASNNRLCDIRTIHGSGGVTFYLVPTGSGASDISVRSGSGSTYTGDTIILARIEVGSTFLPYGSRTGDVYVYGSMRLNQGGYNGTINGLFGSGKVEYGNSGACSLSVGDNNTTSTFNGSITGNNKLAFTKIGSGTLTLGGTCTLALSMAINDGTLVADGYITNTTVTVKTGAILRGKGTIDKAGTAIAVNSGARLAPGDASGTGTMTVRQGNVVFASDAALTVKAGTSGACLLNVASNVTGSVSIPVTVEGEGGGNWKVIEALDIAPTFTSATPGARVYKVGTTQLWVERLPTGTVILVR